MDKDVWNVHVPTELPFCIPSLLVGFITRYVFLFRDWKKSFSLQISALLITLAVYDLLFLICTFPVFCVQAFGSYRGLCATEGYAANVAEAAETAETAETAAETAEEEEGEGEISNLSAWWLNPAQLFCLGQVFLFFLLRQFLFNFFSPPYHNHQMRSFFFSLPPPIIPNPRGRRRQPSISQKRSFN